MGYPEELMRLVVAQRFRYLTLGLASPHPSHYQEKMGEEEQL
jgi:hypothetical protein